ncbi:MAG: glycosyltransferase, partial [Gemmatimonadota bacterium]|nr:glycosyltransferase [Gemmatimonadota bacterium]
MQTLRQPPSPSAGASTSPPGVLFFINDLAMGGAERALVSLVNNARLFRPVIALLRPVMDLADELDPNIEVVCVGPEATEKANRMPAVSSAIPTLAGPRGQPRGRMLLEVPGLLRTAADLARAARQTRCTVVSTFLNRAHTVALTARLLLAPDLRVVVNVHELLTDHLDLHFAPSERRLMQKFITLAFPRANRIVTVAEAVSRDLVDNFAIPAGRITVVHNPVDRVRIGRAGKATVDQSLFEGNTIVAVGRLVRLKGFDILIRALDRLPAKLDARLVIVGDGVERPELERLIAELGLGHRVK